MERIREFIEEHKNIICVIALVIVIVVLVFGKIIAVKTNEDVTPATTPETVETAQPASISSETETSSETTTAEADATPTPTATPAEEVKIVGTETVSETYIGVITAEKDAKEIVAEFANGLDKLSGYKGIYLDESERQTNTGEIIKTYTAYGMYGDEIEVDTTVYCTVTDNEVQIHKVIVWSDDDNTNITLFSDGYVNDELFGQLSSGANTGAWPGN